MFEPIRTLQQLKKNRFRHKKVIGFDIETKDNTNDFVLACMYADDFEKVFYSKEELLTFCNTKKIRDYIIYATNLAFDFLGSFFENNDQWSMNERNGTIYSFTWYQKKGEKLENPVRFYDTLRIVPFSVEKLGQMLQLPKLEHPKAFGREPQNNEELQELVTYCMQDAKISQQFITKLVYPILTKYNIRLKQTIGGVALADWRTNHQPFALFPEEETAREFAFKGYYGGRTETFKRGTFNNVFCFDINSLYPSAMLQEIPNPNKYRIHKQGCLYNILQKEGVSEVKVSVPDMYMPPLPVRRDNKLLFPTGTFKGYYTHIEIRNAIKYGVTILEIGEQITYTETYPFFKSFVEQHYAERREYQKQDSPLQLMEKLLMNNLYGKFAFNYKHTDSIIPEHEFDFEKHVENATYTHPSANSNFMSVKGIGIKPPIYAFPIFSAYITAYARITMYEYLKNPLLQEKIIATDTDSIFLQHYRGEIRESTQIGCMKLEDGYPIERGIFIRPKMYKTHKVKCKGVKFHKDSMNVLFNDILDGKEISQDRFIKLRSVIRSQSHHIYGLLSINQIVTITKHLDLEDTKRVWNTDFNPLEQQDSKPIHIDYDDDLMQIELQNSEKILKEKLKHAYLLEKYQKEMFTKTIGEDTLDSRGKDITKEEFILNESSREWF